MPIKRSSRRFASARLQAIARRLLSASTLCAIATVSPRRRAHVNTAYFAWNPSFELVWLSAPESGHSRNVHLNRSVAVAVFDSTQSWGGRDRGIQLFGSARGLTGVRSREAQRLYARRFRHYRQSELSAYRFYLFRPVRIKLFDERSLGGGVFVTAGVRRGHLMWTRTEVLEG
jgi:uncharacterized protein YhbP (UPF0306 family)